MGKGKLTQKQDIKTIILNSNYYVYELIDPRSNSVFYIGKGKNNRIFDHVKKVKRNSSYKSNIDKNAIIEEIIDSGHDVIEKIVETFDTQEDAIVYEEELIGYYGIENLTNKMSKGSEHIYKKYPFAGFRKSVELSISMLARVKNLKEVELDDKYSFTAYQIYEGIVKEFNHLSNIGGIDFINILNEMLNTKWKGKKRCLV